MLRMSSSQFDPNGHRPIGNRVSRDYGILERERSGSLGLDARELHHLAPFFGFVDQELPELGRRTCKDRDTQVSKPHLDFRISQSRCDLVVKLVDNLAGDALRRAETVPSASLVARQVIRDQGHTRKQLRGFHSGHRQRPQLALFDVLNRGRDVLEHQLYVTSQR